MKNILTYLSKHKFIIIIISYFFILSLLIPLSWDDWAWKSSTGLKRLFTGFDNYNGRYLSNILEIIFVRSFPFRVIIMTLCSSAIVYLIYKLTLKNKKGIVLLFILLLLMLIPIQVFAETYGWLAGYVNYVTSVALMLYIIFLLKTNFDRQSNFKKEAIIFLVGFSSMLFVEHVSLYLLSLIIISNLYYFYVRKKLNFTYFNLLISGTLGFIVMFSNRAYYSIVAGSDNYRTIKVEDTFFIRAIKIYVLQFTKALFVDNLLLLLVLTILIFMIILIKNKTNILVNLSTLLLFSSSILFITFNRTELLNANAAKPLLIMSSLLFTAVVTFFILFLIINFWKTSTLKIMLFYLVSAVILIAPFFLITPFSARCTFASYIFMILIIIEISKYTFKHFKFELLINKEYLISIFIILTLSLSYLLPISINRFIDYQRLSKIQNMESYPKAITMKKVPFTNYHYFINLNENSFMTPFFKEVYNIPKETKINTKKR